MKPTVTELIDILNKPALLKWANKIGLEGVSLDNYKKKSAADGDNIHKQIENDFKYAIPYENEKFKQFKSRYEYVESEPKIECEHYRGRADVILKRDGLFWLFDFKASNNIYFEQKLQLIAYKRILKVDRIGIVNTEYFTENIVDVSPEQEVQYIKILSALFVIWKAKQMI
jgi:hypothetical protein